MDFFLFWAHCALVQAYRFMRFGRTNVNLNPYNYRESNGKKGIQMDFNDPAKAFISTIHPCEYDLIVLDQIRDIYYSGYETPFNKVIYLLLIFPDRMFISLALRKISYYNNNNAINLLRMGLRCSTLRLCLDIGIIYQWTIKS